MIVVDRRDLEGGPRDAKGPGWTSLRLLVKADGTGFSMTDTRVMPGARLELQYLHHVEACYCIGGSAELREVENGVIHQIRPGVLYAPDAHDRHEVTVTSDEPLHLVCVFSPALQGDEVHGPDGSYAAS